MKSHNYRIIITLVCWLATSTLMAQYKPKRDITKDNLPATETSRKTSCKAEKKVESKAEQKVENKAEQKVENKTEKNAERTTASNRYTAKKSRSKRSRSTKDSETVVDTITVVDEPFSIDKTIVSFTAKGGTDTLTVSGSNDWIFTIRPNTTWGQITTDGNRLLLTVAPNNSTIPRTDYFEIAEGQEKIRIFIDQLGLTRQPIVQEDTKTEEEKAKEQMAAAKRAEQIKKAEQKRLAEEKKKVANNDAETIAWIKDHIQFGINIATIDYQLNGDASNYSYHVGPRLRIGKAEHLVNVIGGVDFGMQWGRNSNGTGKIANQFIGTGEIRINAVRTNEVSLFAGIGVEGQLNSAKNGVSCHQGSLAITPKFGITTKHLDMGLDVRIYAKDHTVLTSQSSDTRFGGFISYYF